MIRSVHIDNNRLGRWGICAGRAKRAHAVKPVIINMDTTHHDNGLYGSSLLPSQNIPDFDSRRTRFDSSKRSDRIFKVKPKTNKTTDTSHNAKIQYAPLNTDGDTDSDSDSDGTPSTHSDPPKVLNPHTPTTPQAIDETTPEKRNSSNTINTIATYNTANTINTINTISTMHSIQSNGSAPATVISIESPNTFVPITTITYAQSQRVHKINKKHALLNPMSADSALIRTEDESDDEEDDGSSYTASTSDDDTDHYDDTQLTPRKWQQPLRREIPPPEDLSLSHSLPLSKPSSEYSASIHKRATPRVKSHHDAYHSNSTHEYEFNPHPNYTKIEIFEPKEVAAIFYQLTSIKELDTPTQINVILDEFISDYPPNGDPLPYKYLFRNGIIGNLIFAWNLGVQKINSTLITYSIQSLCRFTHRDEFRAPFLAEHGITLIDKTLSIPSLQSSSKQTPSTQLAPIESAESVDLNFASNSPFGHILAVLKITRDICRLDVIDTMLWCSSKVHQKVLSTMKRDYDEEKITKACRNTLVALLDASYEISEEIIDDAQIHDMIDSFLESTKSDYLMHRSMTQSHSSLPDIAEKASARSNESGSLLSRGRPLFVYNNTETSDSRRSGDAVVDLVAGDSASNKKQIKHGKRKNLLQLEEAAHEILNPHSLKKATQDTNTGVLAVLPRTMSVLTDVTERSEYEDEDEWESDSEEEEEEKEESKSDGSQNTPQPQPQKMQRTKAWNASSGSRGERMVTMVRLPSTKSTLSEMDDAASIHTVNTHICYEGQSEVDSILSLRDYDQMVEDAQERMSDIEERKDGEDTQFELFSDYHEEEKHHTTDAMNRSNAADLSTFSMHSINIDEDAVVIEIELRHHQLLYINSLFHILYKIITVKQAVKQAQTLSRPTSVKGPHKSFMELLQNRRQQERTISGGTAGGLSQMDAVYMSDSETLYHRKRDKAKLKPINHEQNKLLESFFASLSFKNLFKLLKYYRLSTNEDTDDDDDSDSYRGGGGHHTLSITPFSPAFLTVVPPHKEEHHEWVEDNSKMISIEKLACKILRKILSYSQIVTDKLLIDDELDVIGILVTLLFRNPSNIDLIIYILDIFSKITKDNEDIRDLLLSPHHFDTFLCALDPWWMIVIQSTKKLANDRMIEHAVEEKQAKKPHTFLHLELMEPIERITSVDSIGVAENQTIGSELHIEVTIAMLKFFTLLSETNALDMVEYGINDRVLVLLDYYLNISLKYDPYNDESKENQNNSDLNMDYSFVFSHDKHQQCLSLCLECIQNLATDINMLLEFVFDGTVEKLSRICWSFRDHSAMIKKCCDVINKLLKLEQSCKQIANRNVLPPLIWAFQDIFKKTFMETVIDAPKLLIASKLLPTLYTNESESELDSNDVLARHEDNEADGEYDEENEEDDDEENGAMYVDSEDEYSDEDAAQHETNKAAAIQRRVQFNNYDSGRSRHDSHHSMSFPMTSPRTSGIHRRLRDLKEICSVLMKVSYVDKLCVEIVESNLMLLLIECIANKELRIHRHMMISLIVSDLLQHLCKNKKGADALINSNRFEIAKYIVNAIENNMNNRGVVLKYWRALIHLKDANHVRLKQQLIANDCIALLKQIGRQFHEMMDINEIIQSTDEDNDDKHEIGDDENANDGR